MQACECIIVSLGAKGKGGEGGGGKRGPLLLFEYSQPAGNKTYKADNDACSAATVQFIPKSDCTLLTVPMNHTKSPLNPFLFIRGLC